MIRMAFLKDNSDFSAKNDSRILKQSANCTQGLLVKKLVILVSEDGGMTQSDGSRVRERYGMTELWQMGVGIRTQTEFVS